MKKNNKSGKINRFNILSVNVQAFFTILVLVFAILALGVNEKYFIGLEILVGIDLFVMAFNNHRIYHRSKVTVIYILIGLYLFIYALLSILGVI